MASKAWSIRAAASLLAALSIATHARAQEAAASEDRRILAEARHLAGPGAKTLSITLVSVPAEESTPGAEAWIDRADGSQIRLYTESETFRCVRARPQDHQCRLKLASILVHEAWHVAHGASEAGAYDAQIAFLTFNGGSHENVSGVRRARDEVLRLRAAYARRLALARR